MPPVGLDEPVEPEVPVVLEAPDELGPADAGPAPAPVLSVAPGIEELLPELLGLEEELELGLVLDAP
ncbi:MAG: hypothetical protein V7606_3904 [Burkholderiales bacterium]